MSKDVPLAWLCDEIDVAGGSDDLSESIVVALGTDRRALPDDQLPNILDDDRAGVWSDTDAEKIWGGWPVGTRLWLLRRAKIVGQKARGGATIARIDEYLREALQPLVDRKIASMFSVNTSRTDTGIVRSEVVIYRGPEREIALRYQYLWEGIRA